MKKSIFRIALFLPLILCACENTTDPADVNTFVFKPAAGGEHEHSFTSVIYGEETSSQGPFYSFRAYFNVGANSVYDRIGVGFSSAPSNGEYTVEAQGYYANLSPGAAGVNITYDGYNYIGMSGTVTVSTVDGKKRATFANVELSSGALVTGSGTEHGAGSSVSAVIQAP